MQLETIYHLILKNGIRNYKFKNSQLRPKTSPEEENKGSIFGYRSKDDMVHATGVVLTSLEAILENRDRFTHWTPNVYRYGAYSDKNDELHEDTMKRILDKLTPFTLTLILLHQLKKCPLETS